MKQAFAVVAILSLFFVFGQQAAAADLGFDPQLLVGKYVGSFEIRGGGLTTTGVAYLTISGVEGDVVAFVLYFSASPRHPYFNNDIHIRGKLEGNTISSRSAAGTVSLTVLDQNNIEGEARGSFLNAFSVTRKK